MTTGLERIAVKARCEPKLRFTSLAHHITKERVRESLSQIPAKSAAGVDGQTVTEAKESFEEWIAAMLQSVHRKGYRAPEIRRVYTSQSPNVWLMARPLLPELIKAIRVTSRGVSPYFLASKHTLQPRGHADS
jgi:hypothetical protein